MAVKVSESGTYVKMEFNVWFDKKQNVVHLTANDNDIPGNGVHITAKRHTQSDVNLRHLLVKMGCMPDPDWDSGNVDTDKVIEVMGYLPMKNKDATAADEKVPQPQ